MKLTLHVNGVARQTNVEPDTSLLYVLRNDLGLNSPKFGCGLAQCGACTVLVNDEPTRCCVVPVSAVTGRKIQTLEGLGNASKPHPLQEAVIEEQAMQCGYCINGMLMTAAAFLSKNPAPSEQDIRSALNQNLCRCGSHNRILRAVKRAAEQMAP